MAVLGIMVSSTNLYQRDLTHVRFNKCRDQENIVLTANAHRLLQEFMRKPNVATTKNVKARDDGK